MTMSRPSEGWIAGGDQATQQVRGGTAMIPTREPDGVHLLTGELVAADHDSLLILTSAGLVGVSRSRIQRGTVEVVDARGRVERRVLWKFSRSDPPAEDLARFPGTTTARARTWLAETAASLSTSPAPADSVTPH